MMHKTLHARDNFDSLYVSRKVGGRGLASIEDRVEASIQRFENYIKKERRMTDPGHRTTRGSAEQRYPENKMGRKTIVWLF